MGGRLKKEQIEEEMERRERRGRENESGRQEERTVKGKRRQ